MQSVQSIGIAQETKKQVTAEWSRIASVTYLIVQFSFSNLKLKDKSMTLTNHGGLWSVSEVTVSSEQWLLYGPSLFSFQGGNIN